MTSVVSSSTTSARPTASARTLDVAAHVSSLVVAVLTAVAVGKAYGWIAFLFPLGPLAVAAIARPFGARPRAMRSLLAFTTCSGLLIGVGWLGTQAGELWSPLALLFPLALLAFTIGLVNYVLITISRTVRAARGQTFDYPWIPDRVARGFGLEPGWME